MVLNRWTTRDILKRKCFICSSSCFERRILTLGLWDSQAHKYPKLDRWSGRSFYSHIHSQSGEGTPNTMYLGTEWTTRGRLCSIKKEVAPWFLQEGMAGLFEWFHNWQEAETQYSRTSTVPGPHARRVFWPGTLSCGNRGIETAVRLLPIPPGIKAAHNYYNLI